MPTDESLPGRFVTEGMECGLVNWQAGPTRCPGVREASTVVLSEELKNPNPVSGADPSILRGLFHPNASKVAPLDCAMVSAVLNLG